MNIRRTTLVGTCFALLAALANPAAAQRTSGVLVLPVEHQGLPDDVVAVFDAALREEVAAALPRLTLLPPPALSLGDMQLAAGCVEPTPTCLANIGRTIGSSRVIRVVANGSAARVELRVTMVRSRSRRASLYDAQMTQVDADSGSEFRWHVAKALGRDTGPLKGSIELYTSGKVGSLAGAELLLDDQSVPMEALSDLLPGKHRVELRQTGFETFIWMGQVRGGRVTRVAVALQPKQAPPSTPAIAAAPPPAPPVDVPPPPPTAAPEAPPVGQVEATVADDGDPMIFTWILGAGAVVALGTATILAAQTNSLNNEVRDLRLACYGPEAPDYDSDTCRQGRSRETMQFVFWGVSGALVGGAIAAFFLEGGLSDDDNSSDVSVGVMPTPDGVSASFRVDF